jgi:hypothetical protein
MKRNSRILTVLIGVELFFSLCWYLFPANHLYLHLEAVQHIIRGNVLSYPAMGYPLFLLPAVMLGVHIGAWAFYLQLLMCLMGVAIFYLTFHIEPNAWNAFALLPFVAVMALEQSAAIPVYLFLVCFSFLRMRKIWLPAILLGICVLFRTEFLLLLFVPAMLSVKPADGRKFMAVGLGVAVALGVLTGSVFGVNSAGVLYGSLGQLNHNPWGITMDDSCIVRVAHENRVEPWSREGSELFAGLWQKAVSEHPIAYMEKFLVNSTRAILSGPYIGEWRIYGWGLPIKYFLHFVFGLTMLWCYSRWRSIKNLEGGSFVLLCALLLVLSQGFGHQMVRHMNIVYLPLLGLVLEADQKIWNNIISDSMNI